MLSKKDGLEKLILCRYALNGKLQTLCSFHTVCDFLLVIPESYSILDIIFTGDNTN